MNSLFSFLILIAALAVFVSLVIGVIGMVQKDTPPEKQNKMMQFRVGFQFVALMLLGIMFALK